MAAATRDREALEVIATRKFAGCFATGFDLEMLTRRLHIGAYGTLRGGSETYSAQVTFFGVGDFRIENLAAAFPQSATIESFTVTYSDDDETGTAELRGREQWSIAWSFDGVAYSEHPAVVASYSDDF
ncbi:MAG: hypothetical protein GIW95_08730 [Candidatus Eremiobacteraeota bacterium]|nr:hypothetical protein [Candidatus Eremiobacteraeota bacterium]